MTTRRNLFGLFGGALFASSMPVKALAALEAAVPVTPLVVPTSAMLSAELMTITRKAFVPRVLVQIYNASPTLTLLMKGNRE